MGEIVNLRRVRKAKAREEAAALAAARRAEHGLSKSERARAEAQRQETRRVLDGAKLTGDPADN